MTYTNVDGVGTLEREVSTYGAVPMHVADNVRLAIDQLMREIGEAELNDKPRILNKRICLKPSAAPNYIINPWAKNDYQLVLEADIGYKGKTKRFSMEIHHPLWKSQELHQYYAGEKIAKGHDAKEFERMPNVEIDVWENDIGIIRRRYEKMKDEELLSSPIITDFLKAELGYEPAARTAINTFDIHPRIGDNV